MILLRKIFPFVFLLILFPLNEISGQTPEFYRELDYISLEFDYSYQIVPERTGDNSFINLNIAIPLIGLSFVKNENSFVANYEITAELLNEDKEYIKDVSAKEDVTTHNFNDTDNNNLIKITSVEIPVTHGKYILRLTLQDLDTEKKITKEQPVEVPEKKENRVRTSSIIFVYDYNGSKDVIPVEKQVISSVLNKSVNNYLVVFEIFPESSDEKFEIEAEIKTAQRRRRQTYELDRLDNLSGEDRINIVLNLGSDEFSSGIYFIEVKIKSSNGAKAELTKGFSLQWFGSPSTELDMEKAFAQMKYAFKEVMDAKLDTMNFDEKLTLFHSIWLERDPSPGTAANELQNEYFRRALYADMNFTVFQEGWKTDRGMIYMLFGPPNEVSRKDYESGTVPHQYWTYYNYNVTFEFYDRDGFGDLMLTKPFDYSSMFRPIK